MWFLAFHALQSLWYQLAWLVALSAGWTVAGILTVVLIGSLLFPVDYRYLQIFDTERH